MDEAERWLRDNDPDYLASKRKQLDRPYLTERQMADRIGAPNYLGKEVPLSNLTILKDALGIKTRTRQQKQVLENIRDQLE